MFFVILLLGESIVALFTTLLDVRLLANDLLIWLFIFPFVGFWGLQLEGIFSGATEAKSVRDSIALALIIFSAAIWFFVPIYEQHGIWLAFVLFSFGRSFFLSLYVPRLTKTKF
ncbi:DNA-damage-inducible protein [Halalkalibacter wakoensis JCM 9140]|uniref:DNA-damage-inducible protein n=1 Tax=Halalkalibacter wakoensis JCM 9140 TaxID=1236970 RepID=W4PYA0_9BACI|nr:DNA-damage-inducible protein [Halalkalibacter wakoensis JCM 9140]